MMDVCLVFSTGLSTIRGGGIACKLKNVIKETSNEVDYTLFTSIENFESTNLEFFTNLGVDVKAVPLSNNPFLDCWRFLKSAPKKKFDIIHFHELPLAWDIRFGLSEALSLFKPNFITTSLVYEHQIATLGNLHPLHQALQFTVFKSLFPLWDKIIVPSNYMLTEALKLVKSHGDKIEIVPLGVNLEEIQNAVPMKLEQNSLVFFGHLSRIKGVDILIKAFQKVSVRNKDVHLHLVGDGELAGYCKDFVKRNNLNERVHFWGAQPQNILFSLVKAADICVLPSINESGPLVILEAMAAGKPIISTRAGGIPELVHDGRNGILVKLNPNELATAIEFLLDNDNIRNKFGINNSQDIVVRSWKNAAKKYVRLYQSLIDNQSN